MVPASYLGSTRNTSFEFTLAEIFQVEFIRQTRNPTPKVPQRFFGLETVLASQTGVSPTRTHPITIEQHFSTCLSERFLEGSLYSRWFQLCNVVLSGTFHKVSLSVFPFRYIPSWIHTTSIESYTKGSSRVLWIGHGSKGGTWNLLEVLWRRVP